jgi:hypothetical protein
VTVLSRICVVVFQTTLGSPTIKNGVGEIIVTGFFVTIVKIVEVTRHCIANHGSYCSNLNKKLNSNFRKIT